MTPITPEIPSILYWLIGVSVVANFGTIVSLMYFSGRIVWWAAKIDHRVDEHDHEIDDLRNMIISRT